MLASNLAPSWLFMCCYQHERVTGTSHNEELGQVGLKLPQVGVKLVTRLCACCLTLTLCYAMLLTCVHIILMLLDPGQPFLHIYTVTIINVSGSVT